MLPGKLGTAGGSGNKGSMMAGGLFPKVQPFLMEEEVTPKKLDFKPEDKPLHQEELKEELKLEEVQ